MIGVDNMTEAKHSRGYMYSIQYHSEYHQSVKGHFGMVAIERVPLAKKKR